ncbi:hypothetical protein HIM_09611 [Hirsutella minnesotensis 3608]|uniref:Uncharacterized protein n=1 Tax=Hirsutella minnesotensis 3608 TaxID=1043627 RepID=A0A0F7ZL90_9HYPO|nr:hypothetical protein HIM_09611 [Hirsutella minnesotensis 3608]
MSEHAPQDTRQDLGDIVEPFSRPNTEADLARNFLDTLFTYRNNCPIHTRYCWGFFVVRTCFAPGDEAHLSRAMLKLDRLICSRIQIHREIAKLEDPGTYTDDAYLSVDADIVRRYHNILIDDQKIEAAAIDDIKAHVRQWIADLPFKTRGGRYSAFLLLDEEVLCNIERMPDSISAEEWCEVWQRKDTEWVKLVDVHEEGEACRVWVWDLIEAFSLLCDFGYGVSEFPTSPDDLGCGWPFFEP